MAEAILFTIAAQILNKLGSTTLQQIWLAADVRRDLKKLEETVSVVKVVLLDAEKKQSTSEGLRAWLGSLRDVLYDVDNILDAFEYKAIEQQLIKSKTKVRRLFKPSRRFLFSFQMGDKIKKISERLDHIASDRARFQLTELDVDRHVEPREMTHSFVSPSYVIGRDTDEKNIVNLLTCAHTDLNLSVVPIVGIGGLGKTTIAKLVYNNIQVRECFELRMWVCVSDDFDKHKLTKDITKAASHGVDCTGLSFDMLQTHLRETLEDKTFLLVLDDVWNEDQQQWIELQQLLISGAKGSKIIVTTRSHEVAKIMGTTEPYILQGLSNKDSWSLFVNCAFRQGEDRNHQNLVTIGKDIINKCKGVPLAVRSLGNMLFMKTDERDWLSIQKSEIWRLEKNKNGILPALRLSYNQLSSHLKRCFAFCSIFPKDFEFNSRELIGMWMSQGLIQSSIENEELEENGLRYIKELCSRCFFQDIIDIDNNNLRFKMHDLVHDLALLVAQNECYIINNLPMPSTKSPDKFRHVSLCITDDVPASFKLDLRNLWTLYYFPDSRSGGAINESFVQTCILRFKFLRMLDTSCSSFEVLPESIGSLKHLRYLNISENRNMKKLPNAICKLYHLQTLNLDRCTLEGLPRDIGNLINLRRLWVSANTIYLLPNKGIGLLASLRDLCISGCSNLVTSSEGMECMFPSLRSLRIWKCDNLKSWPSIMKHLPALEILSIQLCSKLNLMDSTYDTPLDFNFKSLRYLEISGLPELQALPRWVQGCSNTLHSLKITDCEYLTSLPDWVQLYPSLLLKLVIRQCPRISAMPEGMANLTSLKEVQIKGCSIRLDDRCKPGGEDWDKISHIPLITINGKQITASDDHHHLPRP